MQIKIVTALYSKELGFSPTVVLICIFEKSCQNLNHHNEHILSKMLSSCRDALLKLSKKTSLQKLFPSDCITLKDDQITPFNQEKWNGHNYYPEKEMLSA